MKQPVTVFATATRILAGPGAFERLGAETARLGRRACLVTGRASMRRAGVVDRALALLRAAGVEADVFEGVEEDPGVETVDRIRRLVGDGGAEVVIGIGGGSAMDAAKAAAGLARDSEPTAVFLHEQRKPSDGLPAVAVATTSGTGAEVTPNAVLSDPAARVKASIRNGRFLPAAAIVDPELTLGLPPGTTAASGMDAVTQAVESFVSVNATPITDALAFEAFRLLWGSLERAYADGSDLDARTACSYGSLMAGMALAAARLGAVHGMAHPLGVRYGVPHGLVCAALLPEVVRMNLPFARHKYARLESVTGLDLVDALRDLNGRLGIDEAWSHFEIPETDYALIADESLPSGSLKANPKPFTRDDIIAVLRAVSPRGGGV